MNQDNVTVLDAIDSIKADGEMNVRLIKRGTFPDGQVGWGYHRMSIPADTDTASAILETNKHLTEHLGFPAISAADTLKIQMHRQLITTPLTDIAKLGGAAMETLNADLLARTDGHTQAATQLMDTQAALSAANAELDATKRRLEEVEVNLAIARRALLAPAEPA